MFPVKFSGSILLLTYCSTGLIQKNIVRCIFGNPSFPLTSVMFSVFFASNSHQPRLIVWIIFFGSISIFFSTSCQKQNGIRNIANETFFRNNKRFMLDEMSQTIHNYKNESPKVSYSFFKSCYYIFHHNDCTGQRNTDQHTHQKQLYKL